MGENEEAVTDRRTAPAYMAQAVLGFNEQLESIAELMMVLLLGGMLAARHLSSDALWATPLLFW